MTAAYLLAAGAALAVVVGLVLIIGPRHQALPAGSCVRFDQVDALGPRVYDNNRTVSVHSGEIVTVQLWAGASGSWPWRRPVSSDRAILVPVDVCADPPPITRVQLSPFKALRIGTARITAPALAAGTVDTFTLTVVVNP